MHFSRILWILMVCLHDYYFQLIISSPILQLPSISNPSIHSSPILPSIYVVVVLSCCCCVVIFVVLLLSLCYYHFPSSISPVYLLYISSISPLSRFPIAGIMAGTCSASIKYYMFHLLSLN